MGSHEVDPWYFSPYPVELAEDDVLYICEFTLSYFGSRKQFERFRSKVLSDTLRETKYTATNASRFSKSMAGNSAPGAAISVCFPNSFSTTKLFTTTSIPFVLLHDPTRRNGPPSSRLFFKGKGKRRRIQCRLYFDASAVSAPRIWKSAYRLFIQSF